MHRTIGLTGYRTTVRVRDLELGCGVLENGDAQTFPSKFPTPEAHTIIQQYAVSGWLFSDPKMRDLE